MTCRDAGAKNPQKAIEPRQRLRVIRQIDGDGWIIQILCTSSRKPRYCQVGFEKTQAEAWMHVDDLAKELQFEVERRIKQLASKELDPYHDF